MKTVRVGVRVCVAIYGLLCLIEASAKVCEKLLQFALEILKVPKKKGKRISTQTNRANVSS